MNDAVTIEDTGKRQVKLTQWREFPHAYIMHPPNGAEHFLPLIVAAGAGSSSKGKLYSDEYLGADTITYYWND